MNSSEFAAKIKAKYPEYQEVDDSTLTEKMLDKYPEYKDVVNTEEMGSLKSGALGLMSGIPGGTAAVSGIQAISPDVTYEQAHKGLEEAKDKAWEESPVAYGVGKTAGTVGTALVAPATIPAAIGVGALSGLDAAANLSDIPESAVKGGLVGGALGAAGKYIVEPAVGAVVNKLAPAIGKRAVASLGKPTLQDVESYLQNPEAIRSALTKPQLAEKLAGSVEDVGRASSQLSAGARGMLDTEEGALSAMDLRPVFDGMKQKYLTEGVAATPADEIAIKTLDAQYARLAEIAHANNGEIPQSTLQEIVHKLQQATKENTWGNPDASASQEALKNLSGRLNGLLKQANPAYGEAMVPSAEAAALKSDLTSKFKMETSPMGKVEPSDTTVTKIGTSLKEGKIEEADLFDRLKGITGEDFTDKIKRAATKAAFEDTGAGEGLKNSLTALGFGVGKMTGVPYGGIGGAAVGRAASTAMHGGQIAKKILDTYLAGSEAFSNSALKPAMAKFGPVLINAAKQGGNQLAATHFVLATSNPEYQRLADSMQNESNDVPNSGIVNEE